jgi:hypothetical protein
VSCDDFEELLYLERFPERRNHTWHRRSFRVRTRADQDHRELARVDGIEQVPQEVPATHPRHAVIEEDEARAGKLRDHCERLFAASGFVDPVSRFAQHARECVSNVGIIVYDENLSSHRHAASQPTPHLKTERASMQGSNSTVGARRSVVGPRTSLSAEENG